MGRLRVARSLEEVRAFSPRSSAVTLGVFDGVHRGHQSIIEELIRTRQRPDIESAFLMTFSPHPLVVTQSRDAPRILSTIEERLDLLERFPLDGVLVAKFDEKLRGTEYREFIQKYLLDGFNMKVLVLGYDCHFGKNREGCPESAQAEGRRRGFEVKVVPPFQLNGQIASSTHIRGTLLEGDIALANRLLGHPYTVAGEVVSGAGKGRSLGFPTANLRIAHPRKLWPPGGVYAVRVKIDGEVHNAMMNVGTAPTLKGGERTVEVHIFDFDESIYGERVVAYLYSRLREEVTFPSPEELIYQLERDRVTALEVLCEKGESAWD